VRGPVYLGASVGPPPARYNISPLCTATTDALATPQTSKQTGLNTAGFGFINVLTAPVQGTGILVPRQGSIVARLRF
jgi:hypothetical protein